MKKTASRIMLVLLLISTSAFAFNIQPVRASGTIYIRADGSIDPATAPISSVDNVTYVLTGNINDSIVVERSDTIIDGNRCTVQGSGNGNGFYWSNINNVTVRNMEIKEFYYGILFFESYNNTISGNNITSNNHCGIYLLGLSDHSSISGNNIANNGYGIFIEGSYYSSVSGNIIANNGYGICIEVSEYSSVSGNIIANNGYGICIADTGCISVSGNIIANNGYGIYLGGESGGCSISGNSIANNGYGILLGDSYGNRVYHNNFVDNTYQVQVSAGYEWTNFWDDGYPSGGNYWSDYAGVDVYSGPNQNETGIDGIGDAPYSIDENNQDNYPLMHPYGSIQNLNSGLTYLTIQSAINAPENLNGHTIFVRNGTYYENVVVNKTLWLVGENSEKTIIDGGGIGAVVQPTVNNVTITGFTLRNSRKEFVYGGITLINVANCSVYENKIVDNHSGIFLISSSSNTISRNILAANTFGVAILGSSGNSIFENDIIQNARGVFLSSANNNTVKDNILTNNDGESIYLFECSNNSINENQMKNNIKGIVLDSSRNNRISQNSMTNGSYGITLSASSNNSIFGNNIQTNDAHGIWFFESSDNCIVGNNIEASSWSGIILYQNSNNNSIVGNNITRNREGVSVMFGSSNNTIYHNNFVNNTNQALAYPSLWDNGYPSGGNYWSDYTGVDLYCGSYQNETGSDGIGDTSYVIDENNRDNYPLMKSYPWSSHDVGITSVTTSKTIVGQGYNISISVIVFNYGNYAENLNITISANSTIIGEIDNIDLTSRNSTCITFKWNSTGFSNGNCTIYVFVESVLGETDTTDNNRTQIVIVTVAGDVTSMILGVPDYIVDMRDIGYLCSKFMTDDANCDINNDGIVNMRDIGIACDNFMKES